MAKSSTPNGIGRSASASDVNAEASEFGRTGLRRRMATLAPQRSLILGVALLIALVVAGSVLVPGFFSVNAVRSMLLSASLLGIVALGQTLCALIGGLDLSIPFVVGAANVSLLYLTANRGIPSGIAVLIVIGIAVIVGVINGLISHRQQGQSLVVTLGTGTALLGLTQIITTNSIYSGGTIRGTVPGWITAIATPDGGRSGFGFAPSVLVWLVIAVVAVLLLSRTWTGRAIYAQGGNPVAARRALISERGIWVTTFTISAVMAAIAGMFLLGFSGSAFYDIGQPYLFTTVAAVLIGGTTLIGGRGGYAQTVLGVAILTVLTVVLVGLNLSPAAQEMVLGMVLIPLVAAYARLPHPRLRV